MVKVLRYKSEGRWFDSRWCHWNFSLTYFFRSHYDPGVDSASNRNEYQENFLGGKCGRCIRLTTLPPPCAVVMKSGNLNLLEPSGPLEACNGTDLPFFYMFRSPTCPSSGENCCIYATLVFVTLYEWHPVCWLEPANRMPPVQSDKYQCRIDTVIFS